MSDSLIPSFLVSNASESLRSLTKNEQCERIAEVAHQKWATMSDLLRSLTKNVRPWANCSGRSTKMSKWANRSLFERIAQVAHFFAKNERFARKTDERIPSPDSSFMVTTIDNVVTWALHPGYNLLQVVIVVQLLYNILVPIFGRIKVTILQNVFSFSCRYVCDKNNLWRGVKIILLCL